LRGFEEKGRAAGFLQDRVRRSALGLAVCVQVAVSADHDDRDVGRVRLGLEVVQRAEPVHFGHRTINDDEIWTDAAGEFHCFPAILPEVEGVKSTAAKAGLIKPTHLGFVVDDKDSGAAFDLGHSKERLSVLVLAGSQPGPHKYGFYGNCLQHEIFRICAIFSKGILNHNLAR
jgi:hypothetical protein